MKGYITLTAVKRDYPKNEIREWTEVRLVNPACIESVHQVIYADDDEGFPKERDTTICMTSGDKFSVREKVADVIRLLDAVVKA